MITGRAIQPEFRKGLRYRTTTPGFLSLSSLGGRIARFVTAVLARKPGPGDVKRRRSGLAAAVLLFVGGSIFAVLGLPDVDKEPRWELLAVVGLVGVPLALLLSAAEYQVSAAIASYRVTFGAALRVGVLATAANMLPVPGAVLVRGRAIRRLGASYGKIALATGVVAICFVGMTCAVASAVLIASGEIALGGVLAGAGILGLSMALVMLIVERGSRDGSRLLLAASARAVGAMAVKAGRLYLILLAFGYDAGATQALTLTVAAVIATTLGFFPAGLGAAEVLAAALSPLVGLSAAVGFVANAVDRLISLVGIGLVGGAMLVFDRRRARASASDLDAERAGDTAS